MTRILALQKLRIAEPLEGKHYGSALSSQPTVNTCGVCNN